MDEYRVFAAMEAREPIAVFKKTIVGKVYVTALNPFTGEVEGVHLEGIADRGDEKAFIEIYDKKSLVFFKKINKKQFDLGNVVEVEKSPEVKVSVNQISDEEIEELLNGHFFTLKSKLDSFTEVAPVLRMLNKARDLEKSEKLIKHIEQKMAEVEIRNYETE
jgi:hypothetical protein